MQKILVQAVIITVIIFIGVVFFLLNEESTPARPPATTQRLEEKVINGFDWISDQLTYLTSGFFEAEINEANPETSADEKDTSPYEEITAEYTIRIQCDITDPACVDFITRILPEPPAQSRSAIDLEEHNVELDEKLDNPTINEIEEPAVKASTAPTENRAAQEGISL